MMVAPFVSGSQRKIVSCPVEKVEISRGDLNTPTPPETAGLADPPVSFRPIVPQ
jgi:hypothetical protein